MMGEIEMAISNLYSRVRMHRPDATRLTPIEQLEVVKEVLLDIQGMSSFAIYLQPIYKCILEIIAGQFGSKKEQKGTFSNAKRM